MSYKNIMNKGNRSKYLKQWHSEHSEHERQYYRVYAKSHRDENNLKMRRYRLRVKLEVLSHYSNDNLRCSCCGESTAEFLTLDHINGNGRKEKVQMGLENKSSTAFYLLLKKRGFPSGYQVLCYNCNCGKKLNDGVCPHVKK